MSYNVDRATQAYDSCPRCKSMQVELIEKPYSENRYIFEKLRCYNCCLEFEQVYKYYYTHGVWEENDEEETC